MKQWFDATSSSSAGATGFQVYQKNAAIATLAELVGKGHRKVVKNQLGPSLSALYDDAVAMAAKDAAHEAPQQEGGEDLGDDGSAAVGDAASDAASDAAGAAAGDAAGEAAGDASSVTAGDASSAGEGECEGSDEDKAKKKTKKRMPASRNLKEAAGGKKGKRS